MSFSPDSFAFNNKKTSELLNNVKTSRPVTTFLYITGLLFQYFKNEKKFVRFLLTGLGTFLSLIKKCEPVHEFSIIQIVSDSFQDIQTLKR